LVNAWANLFTRKKRGRVSVIFSGPYFQTDIQKNIVILPPYTTTELLTADLLIRQKQEQEQKGDKKSFNPLAHLKGLDRWRIWRFGAFHESMHLVFTPRNWDAYLVSMGLQWDLLAPDPHATNARPSLPIPLRNAYMLVEDARIEAAGVKLFPGMEIEREFFNDYLNAALYQKYAARPSDERLKLKFQHEVVEALCLYHWLGAKKACEIFDLTAKERAKFAWFSKKIHEISGKPQTAAFNLAMKIYEFACNYESISQSQGAGSVIVTHVGPISSEDLKNFRKMKGRRRGRKQTQEKQPGDKSQSLPGSIIGEDQASFDDMDEIDQAILGEYEIVAADVGVDFSDQKSDPQTGGREGADWPYPKGVIVADPSGDYVALMTGMQGMINRLVSRLQKWKIGWTEQMDEEGDELDIEAVITGARKKFYDERKLRPRGKSYILLDMSGSISGWDRQYKQAFAIICEVFSKIKMNFEAASFPALMGVLRTTISIVKRYNEPWGARSRARLAGLVAFGGTPTDDALSVVSSIASHYGIERVFIITDGSPNDPHATRQEIKKLENRGIRVYGIGIAHAMAISVMRSLFDRLFESKNRYILITSPRDLPNAFIKLIEMEMMR